MKRQIRKIVTTLTMVMMLIGTSIPVFASEGEDQILSSTQSVPESGESEVSVARASFSTTISLVGSQSNGCYASHTATENVYWISAKVSVNNNGNYYNRFTHPITSQELDIK